MSTHPVEVYYFPKPPANAKRAAPGAWPDVIWQSESSPEVFLREVVETLTGFLRKDSESRTVKTGETLPERQ